MKIEGYWQTQIDMNARLLRVDLRLLCEISRAIVSFNELFRYGERQRNSRIAVNRR